MNGGKLVTKEQKEKLDQWYVQNASPLLDTQITMMTIKMILKGRVSTEENLADKQQVQNKDIAFERRSIEGRV